MEPSPRAWPRGLPVLRGLLPVRRSAVAGDIAAGLKLAALARPADPGGQEASEGPEDPLRWLVLDGVAIGDVDYTAGLVLGQVIEELHDKHVVIGISGLLDPVRRQVVRYGIRGKDGPDAYYQTAGEALEASHAAAPK